MLQIDVVQHCAGAVLEAHVAELDLALQAAGMHRLDRFGHAGHAVEDFEDAVGAGGGPLRAVDDAAHRFHAAVEAAHEQHECE